MHLIEESSAIDSLDQEIIKILIDDGRASASHISERIGLSIPAVSERIKKMQDSGLIKGFYVNVDLQKAGYDVQVIVTIVSETSDNYGTIVDNAKKHPRIVQCFTTTGNGSHVLLAATKNTSSLEKLLREIQSWPGVTRTETQLIMKSYL